MPYFDSSFDPPSEPPSNAPRSSVRGGRMIWEECEECEGSGKVPATWTSEGYDDEPFVECPECHGERGRWVEDIPEPDFD